MDPNKPQTLPYTTRLQRIYRAFGFTKGYDFVLWFLFGGAFLAFTGYFFLCPKSSTFVIQLIKESL